ncbi:hypothetical protein M8J75_010547 [Diaphorina citri]|nr:hypothetical protein M8J75_010547 [Diaphorina citri]KAI5695083.1 hypothetical protein M8J75_010547 [Diaphorina citri]KAI5695084.1 hypothetical protein M8J75_010547 [Diaphorina citri]KAI5695085.1 hypothetical protein M8J75_010547 [Diaphorina citri]
MKLVPEPVSLSASCSLYDLKTTVDKLDEKISKMNQVIMECVGDKRTPNPRLEADYRTADNTGAIQDITESSFQARHLQFARNNQGRSKDNESERTTSRYQDITKSSSNITKSSNDISGKSRDITKSSKEITGKSQDITKSSQDITKSSSNITKRKDPNKMARKENEPANLPENQQEEIGKKLERKEVREDKVTSLSKDCELVRKDKLFSMSRNSKLVREDKVYSVSKDGRLVREEKVSPMSKDYQELKACLKNLDRRNSADMDSKSDSSPSPECGVASLSSSSSSSWSALLKSNENRDVPDKPKPLEQARQPYQCLDEIQNFDLERINNIFRSRKK